METFTFDTPLLDMVKKVSGKERARTQSESADSGCYSAPTTPSKFSSGESYTSLFPHSIVSASKFSLCVSPADVSPKEIDFTPPPSPFVQFDRKLTPLEELAIFRLAQRLADHQIKFGVPKFFENTVQYRCNNVSSIGQINAEGSSPTYYSMCNRMDGVLGRSARGVPSACAVVPRRRVRKHLPDFCTFCKNNEESRCHDLPGYVPDESAWNDHRLKDETGRCTCPVLRKHICEYCGASGDGAHTIRYCSKKKEDYIAKGAQY